MAEGKQKPANGATKKTLHLTTAGGRTTIISLEAVSHLESRPADVSTYPGLDYLLASIVAPAIARVNGLSAIFREPASPG